MSTFTENYNLIKPNSEDYYDVADFNENFDAIDTIMAETEREVGRIDTKIGEAEDGETNSIFGKLNHLEAVLGNGIHLIKSIQRVKHEVPAYVTESSCSIQPVDASRCIAIFERLEDSATNGCGEVDYNLQNSSISFTHGRYNFDGDLSIALWIIEFY